MSIEEIATFVEAVTGGSMAAASRSLSVPTSTVSRRIRRLERDLGVQLVEAHARLFRLTEAGDALYKRSAGAVRDLREAEHALRDGSDSVRGRLRVSVPQDLGISEVVVGMLAAFRVAHPGVELLIDLTDLRVDLVANGVDFAVRIHPGPLQAQPSLMTRTLTTLYGGLFASPSYLTQRGVPLVPRDLESHTLISPTFMLPLRLTHQETGAHVVVESTAPVQSTSLGFMAPAALAQMGIAPIPHLVADPHVARGDLVRVLPTYELFGARMSLLWPSSRLPAPRRRTFLDFVVDHTAAWSRPG